MQLQRKTKDFQPHLYLICILLWSVSTPLKLNLIKKNSIPDGKQVALLQNYYRGITTCESMASK